MPWLHHQTSEAPRGLGNADGIHHHRIDHRGRKKSPFTFRAWVTFILGHLQGCYTWEPLFNERRSWILPLSFHFLINRVLPALPRYFHVKAHCWAKHPDTEFFPILISVPGDPSGFLSCVWWAVHWYPSEWMPCGLHTCFSKLREVFNVSQVC